MTMLRRALENSDASTDDNNVSDASKMIVMKGPLAEIYKNALDVLYAKDPATGERIHDDEGKPVLTEPSKECQTISIETEAIDVMLARQLARSMSAQNVKPTDSFQTVYGVSKDAVTDETMVEVTNELAAQPETSSDFVLIVDGTQPSSIGDNTSVPQEKMVQMQNALECVVEAYRGKVYHSLKEFAEARTKSR
jgi:hypothetical protein